MEREEKLMLIQRSLGLRHKLKVHESMKAPDTHEDLAIMMMAKWELEDELRAIEELIAQHRLANIESKRQEIAYDLDLASSSAGTSAKTKTARKKAK
jgi:hypothetical protein